MRYCVVKQFQPSGNLSSQQLTLAQNLFEREAEVLEQLGTTHPQIPDLYAFFPLIVPSLYQAGKEDQFFYLVQEFIDGQTLEEELNSKGAFSEAEALEVLREISNVLQFVHENGSIHRDIKPSNIIRHRNGRLYLLDFGAVKQVTAGATPTGKSTGIYSMGFAPPEQMSGAQVYPSTDLYALAVTVITLLTGKETGELYDGYNNQWNWRNYAQVSNNVADVLDRMLLPTPNQRFQSAQEVLDALTSQPTPSSPRMAITPPPSSTPVNPPQPATVTPPINPASPIHGSNPPPQKTHSITPPSHSKRATFSIVETLSGAAFTGFEGALLFIALGSLIPSSGVSVGLWGMVMGGLIFAEFRRIIEKFDFLIIGGISVALVVAFKGLQGGFPVSFVLVVSVLAGAGAIAVTAIFRLIYLLLSRFL
ncbi:MAG TPA: serine/threonine protein kinase [Cyanobacteria bacterium UBA12227]|nr:serine/threonine protein kinase [Cyanobacteria bacterium UBA12227]